MALAVNNISKKYSKKEFALKNCSFTLQPNTCAGLIGRNGAGKSSLLKIVAGLAAATSGEIFYFGQTPLNDEVKRKLGFFLGAEYLPEEMTGTAFLTFINTIYYPQQATPAEAIHSLIDYFFEEAPGSKLIKHYSLGMRQKIGICAALITQPALLILDEPFVGLDAFAAKKLITLLNQYKQNHSILVSSHDLHYLERICDELLLLEKGEIIYNNTLEDFTINGKKSIEETLFNLFVKEESRNLQALDWLT